MSIDWWKEACEHLSKTDPKLGTIIFQYEEQRLDPSPDPFVTLLKSVVGQQISTRAANNIWARLEKSCPEMTPRTLLRKHRKTLRAAGLSERKVDYVYDICRFFLEEQKVLETFESLGDEEVIERLCTIKGVGRWTAQMFLIFAIGRRDVLPFADLGFLKAINQIYFPHIDFADFSAREKQGELEEITNKWHPWGTVATWYLWKSLNNGPTRY